MEANAHLGPEPLGTKPRTLTDKIVWVSLHVLLFLMPIAMTNLTFAGIGGGLPLTYDQFDLAKVLVLRLATIVGLSAFLIGLLINGGRVRWSRTFWLVLAVLAWFVVTTATSIHPATAFLGKYQRATGLVTWFSYTAVYFLVIQTVDSSARMRSLLRTLFFSSVIVAAYGVLQYLGLHPNVYGDLPFEANRSFAMFGNPDILGGFIVLALPLAVALALTEESPGWRLAYWCGSALNTIVLVTAFTRSAWIGGAFALGVVGVVVLVKRVRLRRLDYIMLGIAAACVLVVGLSSLSATSDVMNVAERFRSIFDIHAGSSETRLQTWGAALRAIKDRPVFGFGLDTFRLVFPTYKPAEYVALSGALSVEDSVHDHPLRIAVSTGIPGLLLLYGLFIWILGRAVKRVFSAAGGGPQVLYAGVWAAAAGFLAHSLLGISVAATSAILWLLLGLLVAPSARDVELPAPRRACGWTAAAATALAAVLFVTAAGVVVAADHQFLLSREDRLTAAQEAEAAQRAVKFNPLNSMYRSEVGLAYFNWASEELAASPASAESDARVLGLLKQSESAFKAAVAFVPNEYDNYVYLANLYNNMARLYDRAYYERAAQVAEQGIRLERYGPGIRAEYAAALDGMGRTTEAIEQLEYALKLDPAFAIAARQLESLVASRDVQTPPALP